MQEVATLCNFLEMLIFSATFDLSGSDSGYKTFVQACSCKTMTQMNIKTFRTPLLSLSSSHNANC